MRDIASLINIAQAMIRSLPNGWEYMKMHLTCNESVKTLEDAMCHLQLKEDLLMASKPGSNVYMDGFNSQGGKGRKRKYQGGNQ